jgi:AcrR family transcriptional regulator
MNMKLSSGFAFALPQGALARRIRQRKRPLQARAQATVEAVLEATLQVLRKEGMGGLNTTKVAQRAGVSVGTLYQYFPDKQSLVMALTVDYAERIVGAIAAAGRGLTGQPLHVALPAMIEAVVRVKREHLPLTLALREALSAATSDTVMREANRSLLGVVQALLEEGVPGLRDSALKARVLISAIEGPISFAMLESPKLLHDEAFTAELVALARGYATQFQLT